MKIREESVKAAYESFLDANIALTGTDQEEDVTDVEERYIFILSAIHRRLSELQACSDPTAHHLKEVTKLPDVKIPTFRGDYSRVSAILRLVRGYRSPQPCIDSGAEVVLSADFPGRGGLLQMKIMSKQSKF